MTEASRAESLTIELKAQLVRARRTAADVGRLLGKSQSQISMRMTGQMHWRIDELFEIADLCDIPLSTLVARAEATARERASA